MIILDLMMPGMNGFEVAESLKGDPATARIPILMLTAKAISAPERDDLLSLRQLPRAERGERSRAAPARDRPPRRACAGSRGCIVIDEAAGSDALLAPKPFACPSCGTESAGHFCTNCGEKRLGLEDRSFRHYLDMLFDFLTPFDSRGYRSLRYLVTKPGFLSVEQLRGSRVRYARPLSLFISINVLYYFSIALVGANTFTTPLSIQLHQNDYYPGFAGREVARHLRADTSHAAGFEAKYNERTNILSKTLVILFIPIYAAIFYGLFFRAPRYFAEHIVVATHLWSFILLLLAIVVPVLAFVAMQWSGAPSVASFLASHDNLVSVFLQVCIALYLALMLRRVYEAGYAFCATVAVVISWAFFHLVWCYRFFLFMITLHSL